MNDRILNTDFVALDFEYATSNKASICSVAIVSFKNGEIIDEFYSLIKPPNNEYNAINTKINKINALLTENSPSFKEIFPEIYTRINNKTIVAHGAFHTEKACLEQAMQLNSIMEVLNINWFCTQNECNCSLSIAAEVCEIELEHHNSLSDARACGILYLKHLKNELPYNKFFIAKFKPREKNESKYSEHLKGDILKPDFENALNKTNPFFKKKVVITGFDFNIKEKIANELKSLGADVDTSVSSKTFFLITGVTVGPSKLKKMQDIINNGEEAYIISLEEYEQIKKINDIYF
jgi:DNA polymerase III subunit epsilon